MKDFYIKNKKILNIVLVIVFSVGFLGIANSVYALEVLDAAVTSILGWIAIAIVAVCGAILTNVIAAVISIAQYNDFIGNAQIVEAWVIIRDLCNMFFVLILLVIAFATILRIESYNVKKLLPKLLIMAVLINFSRIIVGLMIDFSQVIMLTFVNAFADGGGNFVVLMKIDDFLRFAKDSGDWSIDNSINIRSTVTGMLIAVLFIIISTIAMIAVLVVFVMRVIMLWIYVVLSPLAFLLSAFPGGQKYASQYWGDLTKYLVNGPVLAFFIWLALITMSKLDVSSFATIFGGGEVEMLQPENFMHFILAIGFLVGGLMISSQIGGMGASWGASTVKGLGSRAGGLVKKGAIGGVKTGAFWTGRQVDTRQMKAQSWLARGVSKVTGERFGKDYQAKSLNYKIIQDDWKKSRDEKMRDYTGGKVGAWQDTFNSFTAASVGIPIVSKVMEKRAEREIDKNEEVKEEKLTRVEKLESQKRGLDPSKKEDEEKREKIQTEIDPLNGEIKGINDKIVGLRKVDWRIGKMPKQKYFRLEQQRRVNEEASNVSKEELDEEGLVDGYQNETRVDKKRAYFQQLTDINGINTLMQVQGKKMTSSSIREMLEKDFGPVAGDVAADMAKRADMKGNMALVGHATYDIKSGMSKLVAITEKGDQKQIEQAMKKDREKYSQNYARTNHFDGLVDRDENSKPVGLSELGEQQLLGIASNTGRMKEIGNGNFQIRYGNMVVDMADDIQQKINVYEKSEKPDEKAKAAALKGVLGAFQENYAGGGGAKLEKAKGGEKGAEEKNIKNELKEEMEKLKENLKSTSGGIERSQISNKIKDIEEKIKSPDKKQRNKTESTDEEDD